jgi:hypothetical protein
MVLHSSEPKKKKEGNKPLHIRGCFAPPSQLLAATHVEFVGDELEGPLENILWASLLVGPPKNILW